MLQAVNTDFLKPLVPKLAIVSVKICHFLYKLSQQMSVRVSLRIFLGAPARRH